MEPFAPEQQTYWVVQPLVEAGLRPEEIRDLVDRLPDVQAAWVETIDRMITGPAPRR